MPASAAASEPNLQKRIKRDPLGSDPPVPGVVLPDELIWEILTWVPVKSLMRFKCVCKSWRFGIITNPSFAKAYRCGSRGLLIPEYHFLRLMKKRHFFFGNLRDDGSSPTSELSHYLTMEDHGGKLLGCTDVVNGLLCFYHRENSWLYNMATRERLDLPSSGNDAEACSYHLGFDPANETYKLLKICPIYREYQDGDEWFGYEHADFVENLDCEILTIGVDSCWRTISGWGSRPPMEIQTRSVCLGGVLYWNEMLTDYDSSLIDFDVGGEKFERLPTPTLQNPHPISRRFDLPSFGSSLAMIGFIPYGGGNGRGAAIVVHTAGAANNKKTTEMMFWGDGFKVEIPEPLNLDWFTAQAIHANGKVLLADARLSSPRTLYLFDPDRNEYEKIVMHVQPKSAAIVNRHFEHICFNAWFLQ